jgi:dGTPase
MLRNRVAAFQVEDAELAPYANKALFSLGRRHPEPDGECELRTAFQRDVCRVLHSAAFRRLQYKTQVFTSRTDDLCRTRLTHTLAVSQIARTIAGALRANADLSEAISLAHDVGHAPFGHQGERVLNKLMAEHGGFEHNAQAVRVVDLLEFRTPEYRGLNLSYEVREGLARHQTEHDAPVADEEFLLYPQPSLEAQIVEVSDVIAYRSHDLEDGLSSRLISPAQLYAESPPLWRRCLPDGWREMSEDEVASIAPRCLIGALVHDVIRHTMHRMANLGIENAEDVRSHSDRVVAFSQSTHDDSTGLGVFLQANLYGHPVIVAQQQRVEGMLAPLLNDMLDTVRASETGLTQTQTYRRACDAIASMTDRAVEKRSGTNCV